MQTRLRQARGKLAQFLEHEAAAGIIVMFAAALALLVDNSLLSKVYQSLLATPVRVQVGALELNKTLHLFINDGLMTVFFLLVGLEIKREFIRGELSSREQALLPAFAALGGMVVPAAIYAIINIGDPVALRGWAIPSATDIAFALAVLALVGSRVPSSLKVFLLALAIIDDLGAIVVIALFYTTELSQMALALAALGIAILTVLNRRGVTRIAPYILAGVFLWVCVLKSGVHATLAGVVTAFAIPISQRESAGDVGSPLEQLEHMLHPWVAYLILPLFAFANAGVSLSNVTFGALLQPIPLGIALGLLIGKPVGILTASWLAIRSGASRMPEGATWGHLLGISLLAGIGFTMSLFIGMLAFPDPAYATSLRIGVLSGSIVSACVGFVLLRRL